MPLPLLQTKLYRPPPRPNRVQRSVLIARLYGNQAGGLTLVSSPAGFGKTTLVSEWLAQTDQPAAWLALDESDNDPARFLSYLVAALQTCQPTLGESALVLLTAPQTPSIATVLTLLLNDLHTLAAPLVLVLDDYHLITTSAIHDAMTFLIDHLPPIFHLIITTRVDPPWPLARWRTRNQITEVRTEALRFTADEAALFVNEVMGLQLTAIEIAMLEQRTEGWIAGLQLAALSLRGSGDRASFLANFRGTNRLILDYLVEEVLAQQPDEVRRFLLGTALLDRLCADLCDVVLAQSGSQKILERLERTNLFLLPLDQERHWYRYHQLFAEALGYLLRQRGADQLATLYQRASDWHNAAGHTAEAVQYALRGEDWQRAAQIIEQNIVELQGRGEFANLRTWLDALPAHLVYTRPYLCLAYGWSALVVAQYDEVETHLRRAELALAQERPTPVTAQQSEVMGQIAAVRTLLAVFRNESQRALELGQQALQLLPADNNQIRMRLLSALGMAERANGNLRAAAQAFQAASQLAQRTTNPMQRLFVLNGLAEIQEVQGHLVEAGQTFQEAIAAATIPGAGPLPIASLAYAGLGALYRQWNDLSAAEQHLQQALALSKLGGVEITEAYAWLMLALVYQNGGDPVRANAANAQGERLVVGWDHVPQTAQVTTLQSRLSLLRGDLLAAARYCPAMSCDLAALANDWQAAQALMRARILLAQGDVSALPLLHSLSQFAEQSGRKGQLIEILILQSIGLNRQGQLSDALACLETALTLAEPEGYMRLFIDEGAPILPLLRKVAARGMAVGYVSRLLALLDAAQSPIPSLPSGVKPLLEPLSERELEVLRLLAAGLKNQAIADELVIVLGTVKAHINHIYQKLGVVNRVQAIQRGRELQLL